MPNSFDLICRRAVPQTVPHRERGNVAMSGLVLTLVLGAGFVIGMLVQSMLNPAAPSVAGQDASLPARTVVPPTGMDLLATVRAEPTQFGQSRALYALARDADLPGLFALSSEVQRTLQGQPALAALRVVLQRMLALDAKVALRELLTLPMTLQTQLAAELFGEWARQDAAAATAVLPELSKALRAVAAPSVYRVRVQRGEDAATALAAFADNVDKQPLRRAQLADLASTAPSAAFDYAMQVKDPGLLGDSLVLWAEQDPRGAWFAVQSLAASNARDVLELRVLGIWAQQDAGAAVEAIEELASTPQHKHDLKLRVLFELSARDPGAVLAVQASWPTGPEGRMLDADSLRMQRWLVEHPGELLEAGTLTSPPPGVALPVYLEYVQRGLREMVLVDPAQALLRAQELPPAVHDEFLHSVGRDLARGDLDAALTWAANINDAEARDRARTTLLSNSMEPERAASHVNEISDPALRSQAIGAIAENYATIDAANALRWAQQLDDETQRIDGVAAVASAAARQDPAEALRIGRAIADDELRRKWVHYAVFGSWQQDPQVALAAVSAYQPGDEVEAYAGAIEGTATAREGIADLAAQLDRLNATTLWQLPVGELVQRWSVSDAPAAGRWLAAQERRTPPAALPADTGTWLKGVADQWPDTDLGSAGGWASGLRDPKLREQTLAAVLMREGASLALVGEYFGALGSAITRQDVARAAQRRYGATDAAQTQYLLRAAGFDEQELAELMQR